MDRIAAEAPPASGSVRGPPAGVPETAWASCHVKRFMERWHADRAFREAVPRAPVEAFRTRGLQLDPEEVRPVWDGSLQRQLLDGTFSENTLSDAMQQYRAHLRALLAWCGDFKRAGEPAHAGWRAWRERQMARANGNLGRVWARGIIFSTGAYELTRGCSGRCWFCGLDAPRLSGVLERTPENVRWFGDLLEAVASICGRAALRPQFLYWATDPFDNPDYEAFAEDFRAIAGSMPALTTALALRDADRTRAWLQLATARGLPATRFSVPTLTALDALHATFTAEEMAQVECVLLNRESTLSKSNAGRFRARGAQDRSVLDHELVKMHPEGSKLIEQLEQLGPSSIACVAGFLFNAVERTARIIAPCRASDRWPLGYAVFAESRLGGSATLERDLRALVDEGMAVGIPDGTRIAFRSDLRYAREGSGFRVWNHHAGTRFPAERGDFMGDLGDLVAAGVHTEEAIAGRLASTHGALPYETNRVLDSLFRRGLLEELSSQPGCH